MTDRVDRDPRGRFAAGRVSQPGPGRPKGPLRQMTDLLDRADMVGDIDLDTELVEIIRTLFAKAREGDAAAMKLVFDRVFGPVPREHKVDGGLDLESIVKASLHTMPSPSTDELSEDERALVERFRERRAQEKQQQESN